MKQKALFVALSVMMSSAMAADNAALQQQIAALQKQASSLQAQLNQLQKQLVVSKKLTPAPRAKLASHQPAQVTSSNGKEVRYIQGASDTSITVHQLSENPDSLNFYPTALLANEHVVTYIAGTPVVTSPYLGDRPAFDGSDYIVNISSINRDIRLMQQRRRLYQAYQTLGYPAPNMPIMALSGKVEAIAWGSKPYVGDSNGDLDLASSELDVAAAVNQSVEGFMSFAFGTPPAYLNSQRVANSALFLNMGFINVGNLDKSPLYFTVGQLYVPFGRYATAMVSPTLPMILTRTKARPLIFGYKSQQSSGPYLAGYGFKGDNVYGHSGVGGVNAGYIFDHDDWSADVGAGYIGSITDSAGMQWTGVPTGTTFGGFASITNGNENIQKVPGVDVHGTLSVGKFNFTGEYVEATSDFRVQDLSFNGLPAKPSAGQLELGYTFKLFHLPASVGASYQWTKDALALNLPKQTISGLFSISIWKDTVESIEYKHDTDYAASDYANGSAPLGVVNLNTLGTGGTADTVTAQIGVYF